MLCRRRVNMEKIPWMMLAAGAITVANLFVVAAAVLQLWPTK